MQQVVLTLETGRTEDVAHVVGGREAEGQQVRDGVGADQLLLDQLLREVQSHPVAGRAHRQQRRVVLATGVAVGVGEHAAEPGEVRLVRPVVLIPQEIGPQFVEQLPARTVPGGGGCVGPGPGPALGLPVGGVPGTPPCPPGGTPGPVGPDGGFGVAASSRTARASRVRSRRWPVPTTCRAIASR